MDNTKTIAQNILASNKMGILITHAAAKVCTCRLVDDDEESRLYGFSDGSILFMIGYDQIAS